MASSDDRDLLLLPPVSALFLIVFDQKVGYTIAWHRSHPDVDISGVEYQSLPSGLHSVQEDLVYFVHGSQYAGVSAFARGEADAAHRNAEFASVGVLLPLSRGRLGRGWLRADALRELARGVVGNTKDTAALERYWERCQQESKKGEQDNTSEGKGQQPSLRQDSVAQELERRAKGRKRARSKIESALLDDQMSPEHPALSVPALLDLFGPLIFPIYRAALLRKRILCLGAAPVQQNCNAVYILSILASLPPDVKDKVPAAAKTLSQIKPLFNVGIHDIPFLSEQNADEGWIACTTDEILRDKSQLYDILVQFPNSSSPSTSSTSRSPRHWPRLLTSDGTQIKATQRDLRRYRLLRLELRRMRLELRRYTTSESSSEHGNQHPTATTEGDNQNTNDNENHNTATEEETAALLQRTTSVHPIYSFAAHESASAEIVEPVSWTAMAYNGLMWWGSAGEMDSLEAAEIEADRALLDDLPDIDVTFPAAAAAAAAATTAASTDESSVGAHNRDASDDDNDEDENAREQELALRHKAQASATVVVAYFLRLTAQILLSLAGVVDASTEDEGSQAAVAEGAVVIGMEDLAGVGLDTWSAADRVFIREAVKLYFGREVVVDGGGVRLCGVKIC